MTPRTQVCVFYNNGSHLRNLMLQLREHHPMESIVLLLPARGTDDESLEALAGKVIRPPYAGYSMRHPLRLAGLVLEIRKLRCRKFVVMFNSFHLGLLAGLSGAPEREWCDPLGTLHTMDTAGRLVFREAQRRVWGSIVYLLLWTLVRITSVGKGGIKHPRC